MFDIKEILLVAKQEKASDVHITVGIPPKMRVDGNLIAMDFPKLFPADTEEIATRIMNEQQRKKFLEQGEYDMSFSIPQVGRFRVNLFHQRGSIAIAFRLVDSEIPTPKELGIPDSVMGICNKRRGLALVTGPAGSGKSTTLAAMIDTVNKSREAHIITLEDPIEFLHQHNRSIVNQREIGLDSTSYGKALRSALREDPDVILVGEMRDFETISVAITAAETGHLVLSTLHTQGAAGAVDRMIDVFPPHQQQQIRIQLANVLESVIFQQLLPRADRSGRIAAFEVLHSSHAVKNIIREGKTHQLLTVMQTNRKAGMMIMDESILELYGNQFISRETALQFAQDVDAMERKLQA